MKLTCRALVSALVLLPLTYTSTAFAQSPLPFGNRGEIDLEKSYRPSAVFVVSGRLDDPQENNARNGTFRLENQSDDLVNDLRYRLDLLSPLPTDNDANLIEDAPLFYDRQVSDESITMPSGTGQDIAFNYLPPSVPTGDYRLRIMATTSKGRDMGWLDLPLHIESQIKNFITLEPGTIAIPEYPDESFQPQSGPNVSPKGKLTLRATATLNGDAPLTVVPTLEIFEFDIARTRINEVTAKPIRLVPNQATKIDIPLTVAEKPEVYYALLSLRLPKDNQKISTLAGYRWVVRGADADIISMRLIHPAVKHGQKAVLAIDMVGAGDAETKVNSNLIVVLQDNEGAAGSMTVENISLSDAVESGQATIPLTRDLVSPPQIKATLIDTATGQALDQYTVSTNLGLEELRKLSYANTEIWIITGLILLATGVLFAAWWAKLRTQSKNKQRRQAAAS